MRHLVTAVLLAVVWSGCAADVAPESSAAEATAEAPDQLSKVDPGAVDQPDGNPEELQVCLNACRAGGSTILTYCATMPTPQLRALCYIAAGSGTVSCMGFCYARFVD
jgi:hypothetical protein